MEEFMKRTSYVQGLYDETSCYEKLSEAMDAQEVKFKSANRMFFLAIPPNVFVDAANGSAGAAASKCVCLCLFGPVPLFSKSHKILFLYFDRKYKFFL